MFTYEQTVQVPTMSLRDYFAAQALVVTSTWTRTDPEYIAKRAYEFADAMLAERAKTTEKPAAVP